MPRVQPDLNRRTVTLDTQRRSIDLPVDHAGHARRGMQLDLTQAITRSEGSDGEVRTGFRGSFMPFAQQNWIGSKRWGFWETFEPGAITKTISEKFAENNDITFNRDHDNRLLLARTSNGTLRLSRNGTHGLADADMGPYSYARDVALAIERRDLTGMSFAFDMIGWEWRVADDGNDWLVHHEVELFDVAVVGMPANADTDANLRMDLLQVARSAGFDAASFDMLARRLADPDPDLIATLRSLSRGEDPAPVRSTQGDAEENRSSDGTPAETTCDTTNNLLIATMALRTRLQGAAS